MNKEQVIVYRDMIVAVAKDTEMLNLIKLSEKFNKARNERLSPINRINILIKVLLLASSYEERLTEIKIRLSRIRAQIVKEDSKIRKETITSGKFLGVAKKDQDFILEEKCYQTNQLFELIDSKLENVNTALEYVRSAEFNIKTVMSTLKEYFNNVQS